MPGASRTVARSQLRVVSYNVRGIRDDGAALARTVQHLAPDVMVVQEAPRRLGWRTRCAALARAFGLVVVTGGAPAMGNLILADLRVTVTATWSVRFPLTPGRHLRGAAFARCEVAGAPVVVAGSHLSTDPVERPQQARRLAREAAVAAASAPVVLGVDVNDKPDSAAWQALTGGLVDPATGGDASAVTFPSHRPGRRIDAIFVDARLRVASYRVVDIAAARRASDHLPVVAEVSLNGCAPEARAGQDRTERE